MYEAFFGFSQRPFAAAPLANRYFPAGSIDAARQSLARCIERSEGAGLLIGAPGLGKSLLLQVLAAQFAERLSVVQFAAGQLETRRELLQAILFELKLPYRGMEEGELRLALVDHLTRGEKSPQALLLLVDEAHSLPILLLEELRMMTNLARDGEAQVRLVLAGNMDLEELFAGPQLQAFSQRLASRCYLEPFDHAETGDYIRFQVAVAGGQAERVFDASALDAVHRATDGIPRLINQLCDHALLRAYSQERRPLDAGAIQASWADLQQLPGPWEGSTASGRSGGATQAIVEFGPLSDDNEVPGAWQARESSKGAAPLAASALQSAESIELDFTAAFASQRRGTVAQRVGQSAESGVLIVEDEENLQVVVDPYSGLNEVEQETEGTPESVQAQPPLTRREPRRAAASLPRSAALPPQGEMLEEEIVSDRYAALDAKGPLPPVALGATKPQPAQRPHRPGVAHVSANLPEPAAGGAAPSERVTLAEAIERRRAVEAAAAVARSLAAKSSAWSPSDAAIAAALNAASTATHELAATPPGLGPDVTAMGAARDAGIPKRVAASGETMSDTSFEERLAQHLTAVMDPAELEDLRRELAEAASQRAAGGPDDPFSMAHGGGKRDEILVIDENQELAAGAVPAHRVEHQEYKQLFERLRRG
jgi:type II secretory pathway predicted ATPase ExeA